MSLLVYSGGKVKCLFSEVWILVHEVVEVGDLPVAGGLVEGRQDVEELSPANISLKADNVLNVLLVVVTKENLGVVLVLHKELHG